MGLVPKNMEKWEVILLYSRGDTRYTEVVIGNDKFMLDVKKKGEHIYDNCDNLFDARLLGNRENNSCE